ncbi:MAG: hypothetical protein JSS51_01165 [Planctomycetes bacterium]|nr:hypothetical protein [Planctomycetota bacterium]
MKIRATLLLASMGAWAGCSYTPGFDSPNPQMRMMATVQAADSTDPADYPKLVAQLDDDDADTRMLAITVLERRTGTTRGYDYAAPRAEREASVKEWQAWAEQYARQQSVGRSSGSRRGKRKGSERSG